MSLFKNLFNIKITNKRLLLWTGIFWKIVSCACFAGINVIVRYLSGSSLPIEQKLPSWVIMFFQNIIGTTLLLPFIYNKFPQGDKHLIFPKNLKLQIIRILLAVLGIALWYTGLAKMQVTEVVAVSFLSPMLTFIGAVILLKEQLTIKKFIAILLSLIGGFLISRPDRAIVNNFNDWNAIWPLAAALIFAADKLIAKKIAIQHECPKLTALYLLLFTAPLCLIFALLTKTWVIPNQSNILPLLLLGSLSAMAHVSFNKSLKSSDVTVIMPYGISKIIFSIIFSYLVFSETPETFNIWLGVIIISVSTFLLS